MTFFQGLFKVLAGAGSVALVAVLRGVVAYFQGSQPSDVSPTLWLGLSFVGVLGLNYLISKIKLPA